MKTINLVLGTSNCIATGTSEAQIEQLYQRAYKPFLTTLYTFPEISLTLHYNGVLLEWFQDNRPEFVMLLNEMVKRGQIELLGGTFYETVLPLIPSSDRTAQVEMLTTLMRRRFGKRPRGCLGNRAHLGARYAVESEAQRHGLYISRGGSFHRSRVEG